MLKNGSLLTRPTLARQDAPCPKQGRSEWGMMILPSLLVYVAQDGPDEFPTARNFSPAHPLARRDVPLARARASYFLLCNITFALLRESPDCPSLRASDEHRFIVRVLRARRMVWRLPSHPSETARCASTGDSPGHPPLLADSFSLLSRRRIPQQREGNKAKLPVQQKPAEPSGQVPRR